MKTKLVKALCVIAALALMLSACGGGSSDTRQSANTAYAPDNYYAGPQKSVAEGVDSIEFEQAGNSKADQDSVLVRDNTKVIYTANIGLQSTKFDETSRQIEQMVIKAGGYLESENVYNGNMGSTGRYRTASFKARVPSEKYNDFLSGLNENCHVVSLQQNVKDVGEQYFNTEQRLETLKNKHERLEALLKEAKEMKDIISLESALSETEYEINQYTSTLNRYDSLISFSTINIELAEVADPDSAVGDEPGFFERLGKSFKRGLQNAGRAFEDFFMWVSYNVVGIVIFAAVIIALIKIKPAARIRRRLNKKQNELPANDKDK